MIKSVAVLALVLVAVSASYYYKQPRFPCAYEMKTKLYRDDKEEGSVKSLVNGRYAKVKIDNDEYETMILLRADLGGEGNVTAFFAEKGSEYCYVEPVELEDTAYFTSYYTQGLFSYVDGRNWKNKKSVEWKGKKCDRYYDGDDDEDISLYVLDDYIYGMSDRRYAYVFEYKWEAPMEEFVMKEKDYPECVKQEKKVTEVPSEDYIFCAASSLKVAFVAILAAFVVALF